MMMTHEIAMQLAEEVIKKALEDDYQSDYPGLRQAVVNWGDDHHAMFTVFDSYIGLTVCRKDRKVPNYHEGIQYCRINKNFRHISANGEMFVPMFNEFMLIDKMGGLKPLLGL